MRRFLGLLLCSTLCSASLSAPPRIELSLSGDVKTSDRDYSLTCEATACQDDQCLAQEEGRQPCPKITAQAWDAWQGDLTEEVTIRIKMVDDDGEPSDTVVFQSRQHADDDITPFTDNDFLRLRNKRASYVFEYDCLDQEENPADQVTVAFVVNDITAPVFQGAFVEAPEETTVEAGTQFFLPAIDAIDDIDNSVSENIEGRMSFRDAECEKVQSSVDCVHSVPYPESGELQTNAEGVYTITYHVHDNAGSYGEGMKDNSATISRSFKIVDDTAPTIQVNGDDETVQCGTVYNDKGAVASDSVDGDLNVHSNSNVNSNAEGSYTVDYTAHDFAGHAVHASRTVTVVDTLNPTITLRGHSTVVLHANRDTYHESGVDVNDKCTSVEQLMGSLVETWVTDLDTARVGTYEKQYTIEDEKGLSATTTRTIDVVDIDIPIIDVIEGDQQIEACSDTNPGATPCPQGQAEYTDLGAHCSDVHDGDISRRVVTESPSISKDRPGTYVVQYDCKDTSNNSAITMFRKVVVYDNIAPVLTIPDNSNTTWEAGYEYTAPVATAIDNLDGDISQFVGIEGLEDLEHAALHHSGPSQDYTLRYHVRDRSDNYAFLEHVVTVEDNLKPVIALRVPNKKFHVNQMSTDISSTPSSVYLHAYRSHVASDAYKNSDKQKFFEHEFEGPRKSWETGQHRTKASELLHWEEDALMSESDSRSSNAWVVGAVVSATAGFILLAFSNKRRSVSIPV